MPLKDIVIETFHHVIINVAQDDTGTNILLNFVECDNFLLFVLKFFPLISYRYVCTFMAIDNTSFKHCQ